MPKKEKKQETQTQVESGHGDLFSVHDFDVNIDLDVPIGKLASSP